jgi:hypothetical protein
LKGSTAFVLVGDKNPRNAATSSCMPARVVISSGRWRPRQNYWGKKSDPAPTQDHAHTFKTTNTVVKIKQSFFLKTFPCKLSVPPQLPS